MDWAVRSTPARGCWIWQIRRRGIDMGNWARSHPGGTLVIALVLLVLARVAMVLIDNR
jgi:hypothetical protein